MASTVSLQSSLSAGELSPNIYGRTDLDKYHKGCSTCRNFFADYRGGVQSRPGLQYIGTARQCGNAAPPRLIPFSFNINQGYILEFGNQYLRFIFQGNYITEAAESITGITNANPAVVTIPSHGYNPGDWIIIKGVVGMSEINQLAWIVSSVIDANNVTLIDLYDNTLDTTLYAAYISGGFAYRIYTITSPYFAEDLPFLKYTQSADVMTLTCVNTTTDTEYPPYDLARLGNTDWTFTQNTFAATIASPTNVTAIAYSSAQLSTYYSYIVTAVDSVTGEESNPSQAVSVQNNDIAVYAGTNSISWDAVPSASSYNVYASTPSYGFPVTAGNLYGFIGTSAGTNFNDTNIVPDFTTVPPQHFNPFAQGAITDVNPTAGGINYSQQTISWSVTTATGSGFDGEPVVNNGSLAGFVITDEGLNYQIGDTISFTDSGGGVATGNFTFASNISVGSTIGFNGVILGIQPENDASLGPYQINVGNTLQLTLQNLATYLNASNNGNLNVAIYQATPTELIVTYKTPGTDGNAYTLDAQTSGGTASGSTLTNGGTVGTGATATLTIGPETGTFPGSVAYFQQRRVYAASLNQPDTYWMSQPGLFSNMDSSIPTTAADAITGTPWAQQVNGINFLVPMPGGLIVLTGKGAWQVNGGATGTGSIQQPITPIDQLASPQAYNGCSLLVPPITINYDVLYVQSKGSIVRDLSYNFFVNIYTGTDLTVLSDHLFTGYQINQWAWAEEPYKLVWAIRSDGTLLCLTYLKDQTVSFGGQANDVYAWTRHDSNGFFVSVASVTEPPVDAVYFITKRLIPPAITGQGGQYRYYVERLWSGIPLAGPSPFYIENFVCSDAALVYGGQTPAATLNVEAPTGNGVTFFTTDFTTPAFTNANVGDIIRGGGGQAVITSIDMSDTFCVVNIIQPFTQITPDDPFNQVLPIFAGQWSITTPITQLNGLNHLNGMEVCILADGSVVPNQTVTELQPGLFGITLPEPATIVVAGLPYTCQVQTMYLDHPVEGGATIQTRRKNISAVGVRVANSRGISVGADQPDAAVQPLQATIPWTNMNEIKVRNNEVDAGFAVPLFTGDYYKAITSGWDVRGQIAIQQLYPLPAKILAVTAYWSQGDDKG